MSDALANAAELLAEPAPAILLKLMDGPAVPAGELSWVAHVSPQTTSEHLARLIDAEFIVVHRQARHRYYELANQEVAYAVESLLVLSSGQRQALHKTPIRPQMGSLARTCYAHLAGGLGVAITDALVREAYLAPASARVFDITDRGTEWFEQRGICILPPMKGGSTKLARQCADWTERRPHIAGTLGVMLYKRLVEMDWISALQKSRAVGVTLKGREVFLKHFRIVVG